MELRTMDFDPLINSVNERLRKQQTVSPERRAYLEQLARLMCRGYTPDVNFKNIATARCRHNDGDIQIDVGKDIVNQTVTSMDPDVWSLVAQEGLIIHEIGHVLYTDFTAHKDIKNQLGMKEMNAFHDIVWNPAEDAAIEEQLRWKFDCARELDTYNANLFHRQKRGAEMLPIPQATKIAILEKGCYDAGALEEHLAGKRDLVGPADRAFFDNEVVPEVNAMLADVMTEPKPGIRYRRMLEFWEWLKDEMRKEGQNASNEARDGAGDGYEGKPDDTSGMTDGQDADALEDLDEDQVREQLEQMAAPPEQHDWDDILDDDGDGAGEDEDGDEEGAGGAGDDEADDSDGAESDDSGAGGDCDADDGDEQGDEQGGSGGGSGGDEQDGDGEFPGHEGHRLVIKD